MIDNDARGIYDVRVNIREVRKVDSCAFDACDDEFSEYDNMYMGLTNSVSRFRFALKTVKATLAVPGQCPAKSAPSDFSLNFNG